MPANRGPLYRWLEGALSNIRRDPKADNGHQNDVNDAEDKQSPVKIPLSYPDALTGEANERPIQTEGKGDASSLIKRPEGHRRTPVKLTEEQRKERVQQRKEKIRKARVAYRSGAYRKSFYPETYVPENPIVYNASPRYVDHILLYVA